MLGLGQGRPRTQQLTSADPSGIFLSWRYELCGYAL